MTSALSLGLSGPFQSLYVNASFGCSRTSVGSNGTVQHHESRRLSGCSASSASSPSEHPHSESSTARSVSSLNLTVLRANLRTDQRSVSGSLGASRRSSLGSVFSSKIYTHSLTDAEHKDLRLVGLAESEDETKATDHRDHTSIEATVDEQDDTNESLAVRTGNADVIDDMPVSPEPTAFRRWVSTLRRKRHKPTTVTPRTQRWTLDDFERKAASPQARRPSRHHKSSSYASSTGFVTAVKSATATIASVSVATVSRRNSRLRRAQHSSLQSGSDPRPSVDTQRSIVDEAARQRSRKRREKLKELIRTEEGYVADLKALSNAYFTLLGHQQTSVQSSCAISTAQRAISDLVELHDTLLGQLHHVVPFAEYDQSVAKSPPSSRVHTRWHSSDGVPTLSRKRSILTTIRQGRRSLNISRSSDEDHAVSQCSPQIVSAVASAFAEHIERIKSIYGAFGANFEPIQRDIEEIQRHIASWEHYDRAIETLSAHINPIKTREANRKRATTVKDLLIKPIQRLPRYELLFGDLCKLTPVCDSPDSNAVIQELLVKLHEACQHLNRAKENPVRSRMQEMTWLISDRLMFSSQVPRSVYLQLLGQVVLCGCLHIAYRSRDRIRGCYVICILFESTLLLAEADEEQPRYRTLMGIALAHATIEESDNGKGLQCHTAPHSWKVVFERSARMFEIIFTACSAIEASAWRQQLAQRMELQSTAVMEGSANSIELYSPLTAEMRTIGKAFGKPGSFVRRMSVHRTATVGPTSDLNQVVIKNTQAVKEALDNSSHTSLQIPRSQSVALPSHVQTLAPRRADRARLEALLSDVWSKDLIPYPGMSARRSDPLRASANHVIRKFSMASITSNFSSSKRNASSTSISQARKEDMPPPKHPRAGGQDHRKPNRPPLVDFHNAPKAFLPADFELDDAVTKRKKSALRTLTLTMERPFSPLLGNENKTAGLRRAQSVRDVPTRENATPPRPVYTTPRPATPSEDRERGKEVPAKTPRLSKSKNKLFRLFG